MTHVQELLRGERFAFGSNWASFLSLLDDDRVREAEKSLKNRLGVGTLRGKAFLDVGSGSGLFSLAARRLGAHVHSFDYDPQSVACTAELKRRFFPDDPEWTVEEGSILDNQYVSGLGLFDVVYSWGCCTTLVPCGWASSMRSVELCVGGSYSLLFITIKAGNPISGGLLSSFTTSYHGH